MSEESAVATVPQPTRAKQSWWAITTRDSADVGVARETSAFDGAFRLVHDQYVWRGYMTPSRSGRRVGVHHALATTKVFVARKGRRVIGTMTLVQDSLSGMPLEEIYRDEVQDLRARCGRLGEISALAIDPALRRHGTAVLLRLARMLLLYAAEVARLGALCVTVNPRHVEFYCALGFQPLGRLKGFDKVNGAPAVALYLDLTWVREVVAAIADGGTVGELCDAMFAASEVATVLRRLRRDLPGSVMTAEQFTEFFCTDGADAMDRDDAPIAQSFHSDLRIGRRFDPTLPERRGVAQQELQIA